ncbi:Xylose isomerase-like TIM barrel [Planctomycetes bacterium Pan216]|uniref:Xylose isomerase-like TIM barrel n=1 Tax=Kolteria novifilia TaxID=2527975 RepID=A0A518B4J9_9BACT|nr:Xylose isomerase-like TIM barrel [Planctomycetes bacterium Pan216]
MGSLKRREIGVCSWSLQVTNLPQLAGYCEQLGVDLVQIACGDPHHAAWEENETFVDAAKSAPFRLSSAMIGFPGEDYTTPATIQQTGGFGNPKTREERIETFRWAVERTVALGLDKVLCHGGFMPESDGPERDQMLAALRQAAGIAAEKGVTLMLETGQETASCLRRTLDELGEKNLKVNFDPANMLLYNMGNPIEALDLLGPDIAGVHLKDAHPPTTAGEWGAEVPLGTGSVDIPRFVAKLDEIGFEGPLLIEREAGDVPSRLKDIKAGIELLRGLMA